MNRPKEAFTLIELLVVIAIIGILATISVLALSNARAKSRDAKRVGDVKQIQTALELFFNDNNRYPTIAEWNTGKIYSTSTGVTSTYMQTIPIAPTPADGNCSDNQNLISYGSSPDGSSYTISFCIGNTTGTLTPGPQCLTSAGIINGDQCFFPNQLPGLKFWLSADSGIIKNSGNLVSSWSDQSGSDNNATQETETNQPLWVDNQLNGKPIVQFNSDDDYMTFPEVSFSDVTVFGVFYSSTPWKILAYNNDSYGFIGQNLDSIYFTEYQSPSINSFNSPEPTTYKLLTLRNSINDSKGWVNSAYIGSGVHLNQVRYSSMGTWRHWGLSTDLSLAEMIIYDSALSDIDRQKVEDYLKTKYGL